eukprot:gene21326-27356_t
MQIDSNLNYQKKNSSLRKLNSRKAISGSVVSDEDGAVPQTNLAWQKWSGNSAQQLPPDLSRFLKDDEEVEEDDDNNRTGGARGLGSFSAAPELISIPFKSTLWQQITKSGTASASSRQSVSGPGGSGSVNGHVRFSEDGDARPGKAPLGRDDGSIDHVDMLPIKRRCPSNRRYNTLSAVDFLTSMPVFQALSIETLKAAASLAVEESYNKEQPVLRQGQTMATLYVLRRGLVRVSRAAAGNPFVSEEVQTLYSGDVFGYDLNSRSKNAKVANTATSSSIEGVDVSPSVVVDASSFTYTALNDYTEILAVPLDALLEVLQRDSQYQSSMVSKMALFVRSNAYECGQDYLSLHSYTELLRDITHLLPFTVSVNDNINSSSGVSNTVQFNQECLFKIAHLCNPELDFEEVVDELLLQCRAVLQVDRVSVYVVDKLLNTMVLYTSQQSAASPVNANTGNASSGVRMPLKGLASYVALHNVMLNIPDCYNNKLFDSTSDIRSGYRTQQMLCSPIREDIRNASSSVVAVLQCINTKDKRPFNHSHEVVANMICSLVGTKHYLLRLRSSSTIYRSALKIVDPVKFTLTSLFSDKGHRHIKLSVRLVGGGPTGSGSKAFGKIHNTDLLHTYPLNGSIAVMKCDINAEIEFAGVSYSQLPVTAKIVVQLFSKNNHPAGWCGIDLFQFNRVLRTNEVQVCMWDGAYPSTASQSNSLLGYVPNRQQGFEFMQCSFDGDVLSAAQSNALPSRSSATSVEAVASADLDTLVNVNTVGISLSDSDVNVLYEPSLEPIRFLFPSAGTNSASGRAPAPLAPGVKALEWYLNHMSEAERRRVNGLLEGVDVVDPQTLDADSVTLLWRVRQATGKHYPGSIALLMCCLDSGNANMMAEAHRLLSSCVAPAFFDAIQLLDNRFSDYKVRHYAVSVLRSISDSQLTHVLFSLVYMLRYEPYLDSALARFLVQRALINPYGIGQQLLWHLSNSYRVDPVYCASYQLVATLFLRLATDEERVHLTQGMFVVRLVHTSYNKVKLSPTLANKSSKALTPAEATAKSKATLNLLAQEVSAHSMHLPTEFVVPLPHTVVTNKSSAHSTPSSPVSPATPTHLEGQQVVCNQITNWFTADGLPNSFSFALKSNSQPGEKHTVMYSQDVDPRVETMCNQLLHAVDAIWSSESGPLNSLKSVNYNSYLMRDGFSPAAVLLEQPNNCQTLQTVIVKALHAEFLAAKEALDKVGKRGRGKMTDTGPKKIPDSLVEDFLAKREDGSSLDETATDVVRNNFMKSLAAYLVTCHVLSLSGANVSNTSLSKRGDLFVRHPAYVLGVETATLNKKIRASLLSAKTPPFYLPCFAQMVGGEESEEQREFDTLVSTAFVSLRNHISFLIYTVTVASRQLGIHEDVSEVDAVAKLNEHLARGLRADYQLNVSFA